MCTVVHAESEAISVAFDGWGEEWNRTIDDPREIRERSIIGESNGRRKATNLSRKSPQITKVIRDDKLWMGNHEVVVLEVDPIRELITVLLPDDVKASVKPGKLSTTKPEEEKPRRSYKRKCIEEPSTSPPTSYQDKPPERPVSGEDKLEDVCSDMNFDFSVFVLNDGSVLKVGSICFVDSCSSP